jgi:hypothetical protein
MTAGDATGDARGTSGEAGPAATAGTGVVGSNGRGTFSFGSAYFSNLSCFLSIFLGSVTLSSASRF